MAFFSKKKYPPYWNRYLEGFSEKPPKSIVDARFIVFDTETTGLNPSNDKLLSIGAVTVQGNCIDVQQSFEVFVEQEKFTPETVQIHGIRKAGSVNKITEAKAMEAFLDFLENGILVAHHVDFDVAMINGALKQLQLPKLKNNCIDTGDLYRMLLGKPQRPISLDALCEEFGVKTHDRHNALGDALITAMLFQKITRQLQHEKKYTLADLFHTSKSHGW